MSKLKSSIETIVTTLLEKVGVNLISFEEKEIAGQTLYNICLPDAESDLFVGNKGDGLRALNLIVSRMLERQLGERVRVTLDVNDYQKSKIDVIIQAAKNQAERAKKLKYDVELQPTNAYERMLVHAALADDALLETGSIGEGPERRIVIKFVG